MIKLRMYYLHCFNNKFGLISYYESKGTMVKLIEYTFLKSDQTTTMENTFQLFIFFVFWNALLAGITKKYIYSTTKTNLDKLMEKFNIFGKIIIYIITIILIVFSYYILDELAEYIRKYINLVVNPSPIQFIAPNNNKPLNQFLTKSLFFNKETTDELMEIFSNILLNRKIFKKNTTLLLSGLPGVGKTQCAKHMVKLLNGGYVVHLSRLIKSGKLAIKILHDIFEKAKKENRVLLFDDGEMGFMGRRFIFTNPAKKDETIEIMELIIYTMMDFMSKSNVTVIITSNLSKFLYDSSFARRFSSTFEFQLPNLDTLKGIWDLWIPKNIPNRSEIINIYSEESLGLSGRDIMFINNAINNQYSNILLVLNIINEMKHKQTIELHSKCQKFYDDWFVLNNHNEYLEQIVNDIYHK
jgi:hypothetical protein